jgi:hypothetical protein
MDFFKDKTPWDIFNLFFSGFGVTVLILLIGWLAKARKRLASTPKASIFTRYSDYSFRHPTQEELDSVYDFAVQMVGNTLAERSKWISRFKQFPDSLFLLESKSYDNSRREYCGLFTLIPLSTTACTKLDSGSLDATLLQNTDIDPNSPTGIYLSILAARERIAAALLLRKLRDTLEDARYKQLPVYARPVHSPAFPLMAKFGFQPVKSTGATSTSPLTVYKLNRS